MVELGDYMHNFDQGYFNTLQNVKFEPVKDEVCYLEEFQKNQEHLPEAQRTKVIMLSCPCKKCNPFYMDSFPGYGSRWNITCTDATQNFRHW